MLDMKALAAEAGLVDDRAVVVAAARKLQHIDLAGLSTRPASR
jgi:hypothetical protein